MTSVSPAPRKPSGKAAAKPRKRVQPASPAAAEGHAQGATEAVAEAVSGARDLNDLAAGERAANFRHTRAARRAEVIEDYVEMIADLIGQEGEARAVDIARRLGVSHATVVKTVTRLQEIGLVQSRPYRAIFLTDKGRQMAEESRKRHEIVLAFLRAIGVSEDTAHADAEGMEHHCSRETLAAFQRLIDGRGKV
ncbi:MAG: manganese-binding transcriptional regulator MntR [Alphaproteobacteria bacterium]